MASPIGTSLRPMCVTLVGVTAAHAHAVSKGRSEVSDADFNAILAKYKKVRAGKGKK